MAEMGLGYGSEFQLMRFLGHHRNELEKLIHEATGTNGQIEWFDYPYDDNRISGDKEYIGIECFENLDNYKDIEKSWKEYWPQSGNSMNWDGIFKIDDTWFFVEAKAHEKETKQKCGATSEQSKNQIKKAFDDTQKWLGKKEIKNWIDTDCYQLANRLAFVHFCNKCNIKARLVYIGFVNGFRRAKDEVHSVEKWWNIWNEEMKTLGLKIDEVSNIISFVHPICEK